MLAALYDQIAAMRAEAPAIASGKDPKYPDPFPRPGVTAQDGRTPLQRDEDGGVHGGLTEEQAAMLLAASPQYEQDDNGDPEGPPTQ